MSNVIRLRRKVQCAICNEFFGEPVRPRGEFHVPVCPVCVDEVEDREKLAIFTQLLIGDCGQEKLNMEGASDRS